MVQTGCNHRLFMQKLIKCLFFGLFNEKVQNISSLILLKSLSSPPCFCFFLPPVLTANVLPTSSCVCCLIAEPPSPRPRDPPGSMYHLLCPLSYRSFCPPLLFTSCFDLLASHSSHPQTPPVVSIETSSTRLHSH